MPREEESNNLQLPSPLEDLHFKIKEAASMSSKRVDATKAFLQKHWPEPEG